MKSISNGINECGQVTQHYRPSTHATLRAEGCALYTGTIRTVRKLAETRTADGVPQLVAVATDARWLAPVPTPSRLPQNCIGKPGPVLGRPVCVRYTVRQWYGVIVTYAARYVGQQTRHGRCRVAWETNGLAPAKLTARHADVCLECDHMTPSSKGGDS